MEIDDSYGLQVFQEMKEKCADCDINASDMLFDDDSEAGQDEVIEYLLENYQDLYDAAQEG